MDTRTTTAHDLARRSLLLMQRWDDDEAAAVIHPDAANDEAVSEPPAARAAAGGVQGDLRLAARRLRRAGMGRGGAGGRGRPGRRPHRDARPAGGAVPICGPDGHLAQVFASRGRSFAASQTHWYRLAEGASSGMRPTATTSPRPGSSAGCRPARPSRPARPWPAPGRPLHRRLVAAGLPAPEHLQAVGAERPLLQAGVQLVQGEEGAPGDLAGLGADGAVPGDLEQGAPAQVLLAVVAVAEQEPRLRPGPPSSSASSRRAASR